LLGELEVRANVHIIVRERGKVVDRREGHNVVIDAGRAWLASLLACNSFDPDVPERTDRVRYMGVGIGGKQQGDPAANSAPIVTAYPPGFDPNATSGNEYFDQYPILPLITTLERPVRLSGTQNPYDTAPGTDVWLIDDPNFISTHITLTEATFHGRIDVGDIVYGTFTTMPLSEAGLFTTMSPVSKFSSYSPAIAYFSFDTIQKTSTNEIELIWSLRF
jgi:hypothetical protein